MSDQEQVLGDFDPLVVHYRDPESKRVVRVNPFRVIVEKGSRYYEWPKSSGNLWYENRQPAGRLLDDGKILRGEPHKAYAPPMTEDQNIGLQNQSLAQENKKLMAELAAIKQEKELEANFPKVKYNAPDKAAPTPPKPAAKSDDLKE